MIFAFAVKHNGVLYEAGQKVPIGQEPVKENVANDKSVNEIRKELKDKYGIKKFPSNKKSDLVKMLLEAEEAAKKEPEVEDETEDNNDPEVENENEGSEDNEENEDEESSLLDKIMNE